MIRFTKIINGVCTDKWLKWCGASAQSHLGFLILIKTEIVIYVRYKYDEYIRHESIHLLQARELLIIFWYLVYGINFLIAFLPRLFKIIISKESYVSFKTFKNIILTDFWDSYREIIFEVEAYAHENDIDYLKTRKLFACFRKK